MRFGFWGHVKRGRGGSNERTERVWVLANWARKMQMSMIECEQRIDE